MRGKNKTKHEGPSLGMCTTPQINNKVPSTSSSRRLGSVGPALHAARALRSSHPTSSNLAFVWRSQWATHRPCRLVNKRWSVRSRLRQPQQRRTTAGSPTSPGHVESASGVGSSAMALCPSARCARGTDATVCTTSIVGRA